ncbi:MAG: hypothetical protein ACI9TH_002120 [Kiritimatiellia bacterium]|jgi:hypothetical protein
MTPEEIRNRAHEFRDLFLAGDPGTIDHLRTFHPEVAKPEIADLLLDHGAEIDALDEDRRSTPSQWQLNQPTVCRRLIERGACVDLFMAAALGDLNLVKQVLEAEPETIHARTHQKPCSPSREEAPNIYGGDALGACVWGSKNWDETRDSDGPCIQRLVDAGMRVDPIHLDYGSDQVVPVLRRLLKEQI